MQEAGRSGNRENWIDFVKFLGILFVVMNHVGLRIPVISQFGGMFYIPVFFVIAGFNYHIREESFLSFVKRKAGRLLLPYFGYNLFFYVFFMIKDELLPWCLAGKAVTGKDLLSPLLGIFYARYSLYPVGSEENVFFLTLHNSPLWFLPALFLTELLFEGIIRVSRKNWKAFGTNQTLVAAVGIITQYLIPVLLPWSLDMILLFEVLMAAGFLVQKKRRLFGGKWQIKESRKTVFLMITYVISTTLLILAYDVNGPMNLSVADLGEKIVVGMFMAIVSSLLILIACRGMKKVPEKMAFIGRNSLEIMCMHTFVLMFLETGVTLIFPGIFSKTGIMIELSGTWNTQGIFYGMVKAAVVCAVLILIPFGKTVLDRRKG